MPPLVPISFSRFGGLILNQPLDEVGGEQAIDLLDVDWDIPGLVRSREGAKAFTAEPAAENYNALFAHSDTRLLVRRGKKIYVLEGEGKEVAGKSTELTEGTRLTFTRLGTPTASYTYISDAGNSTMRRYDGTSFAEPTATVDGAAGKAMPKAKCLATWADGNRLVSAGTPANSGPNGAVSSGSHVWFSKPGEPEGYESTAYVQLDPGDGEEIIECITWGDLLFVFKQTKMFVFYGVSADEEGEPVFNFRKVDLGTRIPVASVTNGRLVTVSPDGIYFVSGDGVFATTGSEPAKISDDLDLLASTRALVGPALATLGLVRWRYAGSIVYMAGSLYVLLDTLGLGSVQRVLKLDLETQDWTVWTSELNSMTPWRIEASDRLFFSGYAAGKKNIYYYTPAADTDASVAMSPYWQSGFYDAEKPDEKTFTNCKMWGTGEVTLKVAEDFKALGAGIVFKLGAAPVIAQRQAQKGQTGTLFSHQFSGAAPWSVQSLYRYLQSTRVVGTQNP